MTDDTTIIAFRRPGSMIDPLTAAIISDLQDIHHAETKAAALAAIRVFPEKHAIKYAPAVACLTEDAEALLTCFDCPAEHQGHLRPSNPVESVFATVRHRTMRTKFTDGVANSNPAKISAV